jgi:hypothetical protein
MYVSSFLLGRCLRRYLLIIIVLSLAPTPPSYATPMVSDIQLGVEDFLPLPEDHIEQGIAVPALIWRYWQAHGGMEHFGPPLALAERVGAITRQKFTRVVLELHPDQVDTPDLVQLAPLGRVAVASRMFIPAAEQPGVRFFPETSHTLHGAFQRYWERSDGSLLFGPPLSEAFDAPTIDGQRRTMQYFERAVFAYYPEDTSVRLEPLGWVALLRERLATSPTAQQIR